MREFETLILDVKDGIGTITFNRPEISNALDSQMYQDMMTVIPMVSEDPEIRVVVLTGAGRNFCAGGDIVKFRKMLDNKEYFTYDGILHGGQVPVLMKKCKKPIIAMVNGAAVGAGLAFALAADFRVLSPKSRVGMGFIGLGLSGDTGANYLLAKIVGAAKVEELMMLGNIIKGDKAYELGIANILSEEDNLEEVTYKLAKRLAAGPTAAYAFQKDLIYRYMYSNFEAYLGSEAEHMVDCCLTEDFDESVNAFIEKRPPVYKGK